MTETIELIVKVKINYPDKSRRKEAIEIAKRNSKSVSTVGGDIESVPKSAKVHKQKELRVVYSSDTYTA
jgi:hypothetical protein